MTYRSAAVPLLSATVVFLVVGGAAFAYFGGFRQIAAYLRGEAIVVDRPNINLGDVPVDAEVKESIVLTNRSRGLVRIIGANTSCDFAVAQQLPLEIERDQSCALTLLVRVRRGMHNLNHKYVFFVDGGIRPVLVETTGTVKEQTGEPELAQP